MATTKPIRRDKPFDLVNYEPVMCAVSKARAMAWVLEELGANETSTIRNNLCEAMKDKHREEVKSALKNFVGSTKNEGLKGQAEKLLQSIGGK